MRSKNRSTKTRSHSIWCEGEAEYREQLTVETPVSKEQRGEVTNGDEREQQERMKGERSPVSYRPCNSWNKWREAGNEVELAGASTCSRTEQRACCSLCQA